MIWWLSLSVFSFIAGIGVGWFFIGMTRLRVLEDKMAKVIMELQKAAPGLNRRLDDQRTAFVVSDKWEDYEESLREE